MKTPTVQSTAHIELTFKASRFCLAIAANPVVNSALGNLAQRLLLKWMDFVCVSLMKNGGLNVTEFDDNWLNYFHGF